MVKPKRWVPSRFRVDVSARYQAPGVTVVAVLLIAFNLSTEKQRTVARVAVDTRNTRRGRHGYTCGLIKSELETLRDLTRAQPLHRTANA